MVDCDFAIFVKCIRGGDVNKVKAMITRELVDKVDEVGNSPLHFAVMKLNLEMVKLLLDFFKENNMLRPILDKENHNSRTALWFAVMHDEWQIVQHLVDASASICLNPNALLQTFEKYRAEKFHVKAKVLRSKAEKIRNQARLDLMMDLTQEE